MSYYARRQRRMRKSSCAPAGRVQETLEIVMDGDSDIALRREPLPDCTNEVLIPKARSEGKGAPTSVAKMMPGAINMGMDTLIGLDRSTFFRAAP